MSTLRSGRRKTGVPRTPCALQCLPRGYRFYRPVRSRRDSFGILSHPFGVCSSPPPAVIHNAHVRAMGVEPINLSHLLLRQASVPFEYARVGAGRFELSSVKERYLKPPCIPFHHAPVCIRRGAGCPGDIRSAPTGAERRPNSQSRSRARGLKPRAYTISATDAYHIHFSGFRVGAIVSGFLRNPYRTPYGVWLIAAFSFPPDCIFLLLVLPACLYGQI